MSHSPERKEKDCLNCGTIVQGRYCQHCGQENVEPKETFWHMVTHFFYDITHFDGSFFVTIKDLLFKPGFLSKEYMKGRRKMYLHPVRMYVFTSALFFFVLYSLFTVKESDVQAINIPSKTDTLKINNSDTGKINKLGDGGLKFTFGNTNSRFNTVAQYDSAQNSLPEDKRDNWFERFMERRSIQLREKYQGQDARIMVALSNKFIHSFPYLLFVSLPLYALFLKLLYIRRKQFCYADHGVFLIHLYVFTFLLMLLYFSADKLHAATKWGGFEIFNIVLLLAGVFYTLKALKNFYEQGWGKTILKFIIFNLLCLVSLLVLFVFFFLFVFYQA